MMILKKTNLLLGLILFILGGCTPEPKSPSAPPQKTLPLEFLAGTWEVSDAERNGKNTSALEGIYFTFTKDEKLTTNFNLSVETQTFSYRVEDERLRVLSKPEQLYFIESLAKESLVLQTRMRGVRFKLELKTQEEQSMELDNGI